MLKAASRLFFGSVVGKLAGIGREVLLASVYGTSSVVAALRTAQSATLIPINFFTSDILSAAFLPLYSRYQRDNAELANALFWVAALLLTIASLIIVLLLYVAADRWVSLLAPGFDGSTALQTAALLRVFSLGVPFYVAGGLLSYRELGHGSYSMVSTRATMQSVGLILGTLLAWAFDSPILLAWGFTGAYVCYAIWGVLRMARQGKFWPGYRSLAHHLGPVMNRMWHVMRPLLLLPVVLQGGFVVERAVASLLGVAVVAALDYAKFITDTGVLLFAVPVGLASLSVMSRLDDDACAKLLRQTLPALLVIGAPASAYLAFSGHWIIRLIYQRGAFGESSTALTQTILISYAAGFWLQLVSYVLIKVLSARLRNSEVFRIMAVAIVANALIDVCLYSKLGPISLGLGAGVNALIQTLLASRSLTTLSYVGPRLLWYSTGVGLYGFVSLLFPQIGLTEIFIGLVVFVLLWAGLLFTVPLLRSDAIEVFRGATLAISRPKLSSGGR